MSKALSKTLERALLAMSHMKGDSTIDWIEMKKLLDAALGRQPSEAEDDDDPDGRSH